VSLHKKEVDLQDRERQLAEARARVGSAVPIVPANVPPDVNLERPGAERSAMTGFSLLASVF
jgi:hypothetical protein